MLDFFSEDLAFSTEASVLIGWQSKPELQTSTEVTKTGVFTERQSQVQFPLFFRNGEQVLVQNHLTLPDWLH